MVWHRYLGLSAAVFLIVLAVSGMLLNHTESLELDSRFIRAAGLLKWYGIELPQAPVSFRVGERWISDMAGQLYWGRRAVTDLPGPLVGAVAVGPSVIAATADELLVLSEAGELIERLDSMAYGVPQGIDRIAAAPQGRLVVQTPQGIYQSDAELLQWREITDPGVASPTWVRPETAPESLRDALVSFYRGAGVSWERLVQDIHSGRILGRWGVYFVDLLAVLFIFLALAGVWVWGSRRRYGRT